MRRAPAVPADRRLSTFRRCLESGAVRTSRSGANGSRHTATHPNPRPARAAGCLVFHNPKGCAEPVAARALPRADVEMSMSMSIAAKLAATGLRARFSSGRFRDRAGFASAGGEHGPSMASRLHRASSHGHRSSTRPHDASREPPAGWNGRLVAQASGGGDLRGGCIHLDSRGPPPLPFAPRARESAELASLSPAAPAAPPPGSRPRRKPVRARAARRRSPRRRAR